MCFYLLIVLFYMCVCVRVGLHNFFLLNSSGMPFICLIWYCDHTWHDVRSRVMVRLKSNPIWPWHKICVDTVLSVCYTPNSFCSWLDVLYNDFLFQILYIFIILFAEWYCCFSCRSPKYTVSMMNVCGSESFFPDLFSN